VYRVFERIKREAGTRQGRAAQWQSLLQITAIIAGGYALIYALGDWGIFLIALSYCMFFLACYLQGAERLHVIKAIARTVRLLGVNFGQVMALQFMLLLMTFSFLMVLSAPILYMNTTILQWNFAETDVWSRGIVDFILIFCKLYAFYLIVPILASSAAYLYYSLHETDGAHNLKKTIALVGVRNVKHKR
jgi:hypothetical protein